MFFKVHSNGGGALLCLQMATINKSYLDKKSQDQLAAKYNENKTN